MSIAEISARGLSSLFLFGGTDGGASPDADRIPEFYRKLVESYADSATGSKRIVDPAQAIDNVYQRCRAPNWDRQGAQPISYLAVLDAKLLMLALPSYHPVPEIFGEATGAIAFEWYRRPGYRFVLAIFGRGRIEYAGLLGTGNEAYGEVRIENNLPKIIEDHLRQLFAG